MSNEHGGGQIARARIILQSGTAAPEAADRACCTLMGSSDPEDVQIARRYMEGMHQRAIRRVEGSTAAFEWAIVAFFAMITAVVALSFIKSFLEGGAQ